MRYSFYLLVLYSLAACGPALNNKSEVVVPEDIPAQVLLAKMLNALGGAEALQGLKTISIRSTGERFETDEHFMPGDTDKLPIRFAMIGYYDIAGDKMRLDFNRDRPAGKHQSSAVIDGRLGIYLGHESLIRPPGAYAMTSNQWASVRKEQELLNPHIAYRENLLNGSVTMGKKESLDGISHAVLVIERPVAPISLFINTDTGYISKLSTMEIDHLRRDVEINVVFENWEIAQGGVAFPETVTMTVDGEIIHNETRDSVAVNTPLQADLFEFPKGVTPIYDEDLANWGYGNHQANQMMATYGFPQAGQDTNIEVEELVSGVYHVRGAGYHSLVIEQETGIVVVEAPLHERRSQAVLDWIDQTFPEKPITHVIVTHHHQDHTGGLRDYVAKGVTVVAHEYAESFLTSMMVRPSTLRPDALAINPVPLRLETMPSDGSYTLDDPKLAVEVHPLSNKGHSADMMLVYVAGVVFVSDIYKATGPNVPGGLGGALLQSAIEAADLDVSVIAGGHGGTIGYEAFESSLVR